ncbi:MAG: ATP/GTP-binding protein [Bacteroidia bacterium]
MLPYKRLQSLADHKYAINDNFSLLKLASLYGANGAGKSNLVKALYLFQQFIEEGKKPFGLNNSHFKFSDKSEKQVFAVEFVQEEIPFYYGIELQNGIIATEELFVSGLGSAKDELIFERKTSNSGKIEVRFSDDFEQDEKSQILKTVLLEEFFKPDEPILKFVANRDNKFLQKSKKAFRWFADTLNILTPSSKPIALPHLIDIDERLREYANEMMSSFDIGISSLESEKKRLEDFLGEDDDDLVYKLKEQLANSPLKMLNGVSKKGDEIIIVEEGDETWVKQLKLNHNQLHGEKVLFDLDEESDGTIRLLDFIPAFREILTSKKVYIVDEIERSIHPLLIKELIKKFSLDNSTKGQLIFTTHESNLLDQAIFRQDEIWFAEKNKLGSTDLYSLSKFKEHKTLDVQKGYLTGRYGGIPFLGNLKDLNWN